MKRLWILLLSMVMLCSVSCEQEENGGFGAGTPGGKRDEDVTYETNEVLIEATEVHYENVFKMVDFEKNMNAYKVIDGQLWTFLADGDLEIHVYDQAGETVSLIELSEDQPFLGIALTAQGKMMISEEGEQDGWRYIRIYDTDGALLAQSPKVREPKSQTVHSGIFSHEDDIFYYGDYTLFFFDTIDSEPVEYELPCLINRIQPREDGTYFIYGRRGQVIDSDDHYYIFDPKAQTVNEYVHSDTVKDPTELFADTIETYYKDGEFYGHCETGLYVYRDGAPVALINWENSYLDARSIEIKEILSEDCLLITYFDSMNMKYREQLLLRTEERFTKPREIVRVAAVGLDFDHRALVKASIFRFNSTNRDYKIELTDYDADIRYYLVESKNQAEAERIQAMFESDLLSGITYDAYLFPQQSKNRALLANKGLLADLTPYLEEDQLFGGVTTAYSTADGLIAMPFFCRLSTLITTQATLPSTTHLTYDVMRDIAQNLRADETMFVSDVYENLKLTGQYGFLDADEGTCTFDSPEFETFLDFLIAVKGGTYTDESMEVIHDYEFESARGSAARHEFVLMSLDAPDYMKQNRIKFTEFEFNSVYSLVAMFYQFKGQQINYCGYPSEEETTVMMSSDMMYSISTTAASPAGAAAFLQYWLSDDIQTCEAVEGFGLPVTRSAMEQVFPLGRTYFRPGKGGGRSVPSEWLANYPEAVQLGYLYNPEYPEAYQYLGLFDMVMTTEDDRDRFFRFLDRATVKTADDTTLAEIIDEEISFAVGGARSAAETGRILQSRVSIYLNE